MLSVFPIPVWGEHFVKADEFDGSEKIPTVPPERFGEPLKVHWHRCEHLESRSD
jgi:hypothetical protein